MSVTPYGAQQAIAHFTLEGLVAPSCVLSDVELLVTGTLTMQEALSNAYDRFASGSLTR
jgi:hypothetical protein